MVGQDLLNRMELLNQELQLQTGETDVARGLLALNVAQDHLESILALHPDVKGDDIGTLAQTASVETTAFPTGVLRIDRLQFIDPITGLPTWDIDNIRKTGGHATNRFWPWNIISAVSVGKPIGYYTNGRSIFWTPPPDAANTIRWYGFKSQGDITATSTFAYDDIVALPLANFAVQVLRTGLDDTNDGISQIASQIFGPVIEALSDFNRDEAPGFNYKHVHTE